VRFSTKPKKIRFKYCITGYLYMELEKVFDKWRKRLRPDYSIMKSVDSFVDRLNAELKKKKISAECMKGGSIAKDTFLKNDHDVDLFIRFDIRYSEHDISGLTEECLKSLKIKYVRIHGSRDYFQISSNKLNFEIIPVLKVHASNYMDAKNVTDLSPEHVLWVRKYTDKNPSIADEIRLAKQFCKAHSVYGAESYINGFSGHILDILVIHFGSFRNLVVHFSKMDPSLVSSKKPIIVDHERHMKDPVRQLNQSKIGPIIVIDPIQKERNAAAALGADKLGDFITACKSIINDPSDDHFKIRKIGIEDALSSEIKKLRRSGSKRIKVIMINIECLDSSKDIMGTKVMKGCEELVKHSQLSGFQVLSSGWDFNFEKKSAGIFLIYHDGGLSTTQEHQGPPLSAKDACTKFKEAHKTDEVFTRNNRLYAIIKRKFLLPEDFLKNLIQESFLKSRFKEIGIRYVKNPR
jgi:tRNA nucleotidyltransferase (CCA-adding enzyme)